MIAVYVFGGIMLILIASVLIGSVVEKEPTTSGVRGLPPEQQQEAAIEALREIEFEYQTGKLMEADYRQLRSRYAELAIDARDEIAGREGGDGDRCPACGEPTGAGVRYCPHCGVEQSARPGDADDSGS
jgi:hypothetical protein